MDTAEGARFRPIQMMMGPVTTGGRKRMTYRTPTHENTEAIRDARQLGLPKMLLLGVQHMFAMFGATILVPIIVSSKNLTVKQRCGNGEKIPRRGIFP